MKKRTINLISAIVLTATTTSSVAWAHGALSYPQARQWRCSSGASPNKSTPWNGGDDPICKALAADGKQRVFTDWSGVNQGGAGGHSSNPSYKKDPLGAHKTAIGKNNPICGAGKGGAWNALNDPKYHWEDYATKIQPGNQEFTYVVTAPHNTYPNGYVDVYITKDSWQPGTPVHFSDLDPKPICHYVPDGRTSPLQTGEEKDGTRSKFESFKCHIPENKRGGHVLFTVWQRNDSAEAFYSCSDVDIDNGQPVESHWDQLVNDAGNTGLPTYTNLQDGDTIKFVTENKKEQDKATAQVVISHENMDTWQYNIANQINNENALNSAIKIGHLSRDKQHVVPAKDDQNDVYISQEVTNPNNYTWSITHEHAKPEPESNSWKALNGSGRSDNALYDIPGLKIGDQLVFRLFDNSENLRTGILAGNQDADSVKITLTEQNIGHWKYALAKAFDQTASKKGIIQIGALDKASDSVDPTRSDDNRVYIQKQAAEKRGVNYSWIIDVHSSPDPIPQPSQWNNSKSYQFGDFVTYQGQAYYCLVANQGLTPDQNLEWLPVNLDQTSQWQQDKSYAKGDVVYQQHDDKKVHYIAVFDQSGRNPEGDIDGRLAWSKAHFSNE